MPPKEDKLAKKALREQQKAIQPKECLKHLKAILDTQIVSSDFGSAVVTSLAEHEVQFEIRNHLTEGVVTFERQQQNTMDEENYVLLLKRGAEIIQLIKDQALISSIQSVQEIYTNQKLSLIIYGLKAFCKSSSNSVSRMQIEKELTKLQIFTKCSHRLIETGRDVGLVISQFAKAVAEIPFKRQINEKYDNENFYFANDNKDCVKVQNSVGLTRLWQQHLVKLPMVTLETAQAVMNAYPMPKLLFSAFEKSDDPENLLKDLPCRRAGGPLATNRRLGPEMSRKIYLFYSSLDPNTNLNS